MVHGGAMEKDRVTVGIGEITLSNSLPETRSQVDSEIGVPLI